ncbi:diguanylate cyclase/phosphodiesterase (GGDEF & EAL domains) with PAS/PAC sensor [Collimonas arenae]|uniref:Diguanylate cyclase/phosphodiesterase (GGDEF & EAL domains) with PAS/PAC sensor n=1 Tax=Collimonas arenae TaxID=279058 RepID=A0A0A1FF52_9BURK|nr:EAL domain-containing protein [Collimonas arenae]AIY42259.1 diguanylate cyclase/phosphodiesterase (GGDEF & EAL domains) with PAS/PAC sensor [Collimonas arenae]
MNATPKENKTVLIVDDDAMTRVLVVEALEPEGFVVEEADSGARGIEMFQQICPDIILLDVSMPGMDGFECCRRIRSLPYGERLPIVVLTGNDDDDSITRAFESGATDFASKPMRWKLLGHRVRYLLRASETLESLARSEASLKYAQELAHVGNWEYQPGNPDGYWSPEVYRILGLDAKKSPSSFESLMQRVPEDDQPQLLQSFINLRTEGTSYQIEHRITRPDGAEQIIFQQAEAVREQGRTLALRGTLQDITERKKNEAKIEYLVNHDALTDLPNRNLLSVRMSQAIEQAHRGGQHMAVMVLDLDRFKFVNDSFGHHIGDSLLKAVAARLKAAVRDGDTVARLGGDEFVVILPGLTAPENAMIVAAKIVTSFNEMFALGDHELHVTTSVGVSIYPEDGINGDTLLKTADAALYAAKDKGRNCAHCYTAEMGVQIEEQADLEKGLHQALLRKELELHYQPKVSLKSGQVYGVEALIRWRRPGIGLIPPDSFIPLAEETGLIIPIGEWVLRNACAQVKAWHIAGYKDLTIAVNVSALQFRQQNIPELVRNVLADSKLEPKYLELELTESVLMQDPETIALAMRELKEIGVRLSLDDFGTGYSSLSYLKQFPIDVVKIDQSFIRDVTSSINGASLTKSIISMAESLHMTTVAEGVETEEQLGFLNINRCDAIQGYYFSRPLPLNEMVKLLAEKTHLPSDRCHSESAKRTVLLVDDDKKTLSALKQLLGREGYHILSTTSQQEALELLTLHPVGVVICDAGMPEIPGTELLLQIKNLYPEIVRLMLSDYTELQTVTDAINEGTVHKFLSKPWDDDLLLAQLVESFQQHEVNAQTTQTPDIRA